MYLINIKQDEEVIMQKSMTILLCIVLVISLQIWQADAVSAQEIKGKAFECNIAGTWRAGVGNGFTTWIPTDPTGRRFSVRVDHAIPEDPTLFGVFPTAKALTQFIGAGVKISQNLYKWTITQIAVDENGIPLGELELSGETKFINCDTRVFSDRYRLLNSEGEEIFPGFCGFETGYSYRYEIIPPCDELPPFPE
jgi:hypothetical protein